jgi:hypothetical protein
MPENWTARAATALVLLPDSQYNSSSWESWVTDKLTFTSCHWHGAVNLPSALAWHYASMRPFVVLPRNLSPFVATKKPQEGEALIILYYVQTPDADELSMLLLIKQHDPVNEQEQEGAWEIVADEQSIRSFGETIINSFYNPMQYNPAPSQQFFEIILMWVTEPPAVNTMRQEPAAAR